MWFAELYLHDSVQRGGRPIRSVYTGDSLSDAKDWVASVIKWVAERNYSERGYVKNITITNVRPS